MNILIAGSDTPGALEQYCAAALREAGHTIHYCDLYDQMYRYCHFLETPVVAGIERSYWRRHYNVRLLKLVKTLRPDLVFVFKGLEIYPDTLQKIRLSKPRPLLINWNPDSPFDYATHNTSRHLVESISLFDCYLIWDTDLFSPLTEVGAQKVVYLPFGYARGQHIRVDLEDGDRKNLQTQICFVGGYTAERASLLELLAQQHTVGIWGTGWNRLPTASPLRGCIRGGWTWGYEMSKVFCAAEIVMNFIRPQNGNAHNMRTFEAPATGAFMLSTRTRDQEGWLPEKIGAEYFADPLEMADKATYYLAHPVEREQIAQVGYDLIMTGEHSYHDRMRQLIGIVSTL